MTRAEAISRLAASIDADEPSILAAACTCPDQLTAGARMTCADCDPVAEQRAKAREWAKRLKAGR